MSSVNQATQSAGSAAVASTDAPQRLVTRPEPTTSAVHRFISAMPLDIQRSFTTEQIQEISKALTRRRSSGPFVSLRLRFLRCFLTVYAGREKRSPQRIRIDRLKHRPLSPGNLIMAGLLLIGAACTALTAWRFVATGSI